MELAVIHQIFESTLTKLDQVATIKLWPTQNHLKTPAPHYAHLITQSQPKFDPNIPNPSTQKLSQEFSAVEDLQVNKNLVVEDKNLFTSHPENIENNLCKTRTNIQLDLITHSSHNLQQTQTVHSSLTQNSKNFNSDTGKLSEDGYKMKNFKNMNFKSMKKLRVWDVRKIVRLARAKWPAEYFLLSRKFFQSQTSSLFLCFCLTSLFWHV